MMSQAKTINPKSTMQIFTPLIGPSIKSMIINMTYQE